MLGFRILTAVLLVALAGCASPPRLPALPLALASETSPFGISNARYYPDTDGKKLEALGKASIQKEIRANAGKLSSLPVSFLAISGGGDSGAFGAGLLCGWSKRGDRPKFKLVTGVSTGALSAPFVFLGPDYDHALAQVYTTIEASDVFEPRKALVAAVSADALTDSAPLRGMISRFIDRQMISRISEEYAKGRLLLIMTTNLDQGRPVIWDIGAIAASGAPETRELIVDILMASAAIPGVFPPVMLDVSHAGTSYQEMHVDGGTTAQAFLYPPTFNLNRAAGQDRVIRKRVAYIIRNGRLFREESVVQRQTLSVATEAASAMIAANGTNDTFRIYLTTKRDGVDYNLAYIDDDFTEPYQGPFDRAYMNKLFDYGFELARAGYQWRKAPPGFGD
ncbi:MAG: patatin-like phospholipase family protein [Hyphomicrobium sp.]|nr:patatin-like phospholipase family protein [Hyphomicrobium sp.]